MDNSHDSVVLPPQDPHAYEDNWTLNDMRAFNKNIIEEKVVACQWMNDGIPCNEPVKGKDLRTHLYHAHGVTDESQPYPCLWNGCSSNPMRKSSLERHLVEQHVPVRWACPYTGCQETFTRDRTLNNHIAQHH